VCLAISPPSDIVLDVLRAADPHSVAAAKAKLAAAKPAADFAVDAPAQALTSPVRAARKSERPEAYQKFEAMVLQSFLQSMMPSEQTSVYGEGMAGDMWKSMLAEQVAGVMAKRGGIGIADKVLGDYTVQDDKKVALTDATSETANVQRGENALLSSALVDEMQRRLVQSIRQDASSTGITAAKP
jgi:peptidoglycan hydrolase FlgJ